MKAKAFEILLVEDDPGDADLIQEYMEETKVKVTINVVEDGAKALAYLRREEQYTTATRPNLILLDLNLPKKDGREVLQDIKNDDTLKYIPVVVLTNSDADEDILKSYNLGANCYVIKPAGLDEFAHIVHLIENFWFAIVKLPRSPNK